MAALSDGRTLMICFLFLHLVQATVQRYNELQKETMSLQAVFELRCQEVKSLRQELEKASIAAAEAPILRERTLSLANHVEGLEAQLDHKNNEER